VPPEGYEEAREFLAWVDGLVARHGRERVLAVVDALRTELNKREDERRAER